jgi:hypothetical protein
MKLVAGKYKALVTSFEFGESETGKSFIMLTFEVQEGTYAGEVINCWKYLTENTATYTIQSLRVCGWKGSELNEEMEGLGELPVEIVVESETYNGKDRLKVKYINQIGGKNSLNKKPIKSEQLALLSALLKANIESESVVEGERVSRQAIDTSSKTAGMSNEEALEAGGLW